MWLYQPLPLAGVSGASPDVTLALDATSTSITSAAGSLVQSADVPLVGEASTSGQGGVALVNDEEQLIGAEATGALGSYALNNSVRLRSRKVASGSSAEHALTTNLATFSAGSVSVQETGISVLLGGTGVAVSQQSFPTKQVAALLTTGLITSSRGTLTGNVSGTSGSGFWTIPTQADEQATYENVLGWTWAAADKVPEFASTAPVISVGSVHNDTEADDLWNHQQQVQRSSSSSSTWNSWANAWNTYFKSGAYFTNVQSTCGGTPDHLYGYGLVLRHLAVGDQAAQNEAERILEMVESHILGLVPGTDAPSGSNGRRYARFLILAVWVAQANPITRWITLRERMIDLWVQNPEWSDSSTLGLGIKWGGLHHYSRSGISSATGGALDTFDWDSGIRIQHGPYHGQIAEGLWKAYLATNRTDVRDMLIDIAKFAYYYVCPPNKINSFVSHSWGTNNGLWWSRSDPNSYDQSTLPTHSNPDTAPVEVGYNMVPVNMLVFGYKLTGHKGMLRRAHEVLRKATQYNANAAGTAKSVADNEVDHYLDTKNNSDLVYFEFNKGELQYGYQVFENSGVPVVETPWPPYSVPTTSGQVVAIGTNFPKDCRPAEQTINQWNYGLFQYYGGGRLVEDYSLGGAWVVAGSGGHVVPPNIGAGVFDFQDATWKRVYTGGTTSSVLSGTLVNGMPYRPTDYAFPGEISNGELIGASPPEIPAPAHLHGSTGQVRTGDGGGPKGSFMRLTGEAAGFSGGTGSIRSHTFDLDTGVWTRRSVNGCLTSPNHRSAVYDPQTNRYYMLHHQMFSRSSVDYLDGNDWTWKLRTHAAMNLSPTVSDGVFIDSQRHMLLMPTLDNKLLALDLDSSSSPWVQLSKTGTLPSSSKANHVSWVFYPPDGCFYMHLGQGNAILHKLTPPAINIDPMSGTWTYSTVTLSQSLPLHDGTALNPNSPVHCTNFFFVPSLNCLCWIPGDNNYAPTTTNQVYLIKP